MSKFKVGDWVRCVKESHDAKVGQEHIVAFSDDDGTMMLESDAWWHSQHDFVLTPPPQPAESPDDWVTQDLEPSRFGVDEYRWVFRSRHAKQWAPAVNFYKQRHGYIDNVGDRYEVRCRRRDYPQKPIEVHTGGPYVARSEYERVCGELANEKASSGQVIAGLRAVHSQLQHEQGLLLADLKNFEETTAALNKRVLGGNPNGWPLVPVDPSCIPDGHRAVEVTCATAGKLVASSDGNARHFNGTHIVPRLVVEPIPTPAPDALPRPEFPAWIRAGWWVAMDANKEWFAYDIEPLPDKADCDWYVRCNFTYVSNPTESMQSVPSDRWREAKWQVE